MGIGAVGDQRIGMLDHFRRDVGVQVEADHQRQIVADRLAHAGENFAFAVVEMFGHHRAVQVEIDRIELYLLRRCPRSSPWRCARRRPR